MGSVTGVYPKSRMDDYSWDELARIARVMSAAGGKWRGIEVAKEYNLCTPSGSLNGAQKKTLRLKNGLCTDAVIIGLMHDKRAYSDDLAGISFQTVNCVTFVPMNSYGGNRYGWQGSDLRHWLNSEFLRFLPDDLSRSIIPVEKRTNNKGKTNGSSDVTETNDQIWVPSLVELVGLLDRDSFLDHARFTADIYNAEGKQYELYKYYDVVFGGGCSEISKEWCWWERSCLPTYDDLWWVVNKMGFVDRSRDPASNGGVAPCFCL
ncbi:Uncharacterised protein [Slackia heliotrinireducens]|uniref:DUF6273 domain-containing protein n=1 Tax=Slackia heliotrinireducens (strain ATCC 29202 / DSM 20476 / NCTC 11029 / RHS 1) TaxID=471855 RepID=C7N4S2_SLAHD|nr:DUF6273 domain-containing protein [Slackia heliotrinireducens]ACV21907.1 hypothetical protein Shel_08560 [Slackia heliotrinireducens DSM 20476]VEG99712.1 Uncharacterised protein [Slackia heliotrinireducens]